MPTERKDASVKIKSRNRLVRAQARKKVENRLTKKYGGTPSARKRAKSFMKGKDVYKTKRGLELINSRLHGSKHGRGHKGPARVYRRK